MASIHDAYECAAQSWAAGLGVCASLPSRSDRITNRISSAVWKQDLLVFHVTRLRGDILRSMGTTWNSHTVLYAEEGVWLCERGLLKVFSTSSGDQDSERLFSSTMGKSKSERGGHTQSTSTALRSSMPGSPGKLFLERDGRRMGKVEVNDNIADARYRNDCTSKTLCPGGKLEPMQNATSMKRTKVGDRGDSSKSRDATEEFMTIKELHGILHLAGVPWECYRAYSELKLRSYIVRRRRRDAIGWNGRSSAGVLMQFSPLDTNERMDSSDLPRSFDVYEPNKEFRKKRPGSPHYVVAVCRFEQSMPRHNELFDAVEDCRRLSSSRSSSSDVHGKRRPNHEDDLRDATVSHGNVAPDERGTQTRKSRGTSEGASPDQHDVPSQNSVGIDFSFPEHMTSSALQLGSTGETIPAGFSSATHEDEVGCFPSPAPEPDRYDVERDKDSGLELVATSEASAIRLRIAVVSSDGVVHFLDIGPHDYNSPK